MEKDIPHIESNETLSNLDGDDPYSEELEHLVRIEMQSAVESPDRVQREEVISFLYRVARPAGVSTERLNDLYGGALSDMERPRGFWDEIRYARSAVSGEKVQMWPPAPEQISALNRRIRHHL